MKDMRGRSRKQQKNNNKTDQKKKRKQSCGMYVYRFVYKL